MLIVGLPRSRTAWLSAFMSQSSTYFHHEAIDGCKSIDEYRNKVNGCGDSTTGFPFLKGEMENKKIVIIKKNNEQIEDCIKWSDETFGIDSRELVGEMNNQLNDIDGLVVFQSEIDDRLRDIWEFLVDDTWDNRYSNLSKLNVQAISHDIDEDALKALYETMQ